MNQEETSTPENRPNIKIIGGDSDPKGHKFSVPLANREQEDGTVVPAIAPSPAKSKLLVTLDDVTPLRGWERMQEVYAVVLGYDVTGKVDLNQSPGDNPLLDNLFPEGHSGRNYYYGTISPVIKMRRNRQHVFPGGFPLFYADPYPWTSFYFALVESDAAARDWGKVLKDGRKDFQGVFDGALDKIAKETTGGAISGVFQLLTKGLELILLNNRDDLRYSNVFTFREEDHWLGGTHRDWGNHRMGFTVSVDPPQ